MKQTCPYGELEDHAFWSKSVAQRSAKYVAPIVCAPFKIHRTDKIASAGSCFAQNLTRRLGVAGYNYLVTEPGYERMGPRLMSKFNYGTYSARYGNIYSARQLLQLFERAYGTFTPSEPWWQNGRYWIDPFRPLIQPNGFETLREAELDRAQHLRCVRQMMESLDVFIFTLGLTETWLCKGDGAVLPVCPGCGAGSFNPERYEFKNFDVDEVVADFASFAHKLRIVNPQSRILLTVSPVPLVATFSRNHVLSATTYSKAVLRVAAERIATSIGNCAYFPSYEIISGAFNRGQYFEDDLRNVNALGVDHVMRVFFDHFCADPQGAMADTTASPRAASELKRGRNLLDVLCDEYASLQSSAEDAPHDE